MVLQLEHYRDDHNLSLSFLADQLRKGTLAVFLGSGASKDVGLPVWWELVNRCLDSAGLGGHLAADSTNDDLRAAIDRVEVGRTFHEYREVVRKALYDGISLTNAIVSKRLLIALGALMMRSRRGSAGTVVTFNFDSVLEWYLQLHGFVSQVVTDLPVLLKDADVTIYHPHGCISHDRKSDSGFLVFSQHSYDERLSIKVDEWRQLVHNVLATRYGLFIGLSGDDPIIGPTLAGVREAALKTRKATGFWFLGPSAHNKPDSYFLERNVIPLTFPSFDSYSTFLLDVCQEAAVE